MVCRRGTPRPLLEADVNTAARGVFEHLFGLVGEVVAPKTVNEEQSGYCERASLSAYGQRALTPKRTLWGGGALQLLEHAVLLDAARDDDGGGDT